MFLGISLIHSLSSSGSGSDSGPCTSLKLISTMSDMIWFLGCRQTIQTIIATLAHDDSPNSNSALLDTLDGLLCSGSYSIYLLLLSHIPEFSLAFFKPNPGKLMQQSMDSAMKFQNIACYCYPAKIPLYSTLTPHLSIASTVIRLTAIFAKRQLDRNATL